jgi:SAM-dependent methyltransferase
VEGDMTDLSTFPDESFDLIVHPVANVYVPDVQPVWAEAHRVLRPSGELLAGFMNPFVYIFDQDALAEGRLEVRHQLPYSELTSISPEDRQRLVDEGDALQFSHTLEEQIEGQLAAGFQLIGLFEDRREDHPLSAFMTTHLATRARRGTSLYRDALPGARAFSDAPAGPRRNEMRPFAGWRYPWMKAELLETPNRQSQPLSRASWAVRPLG